MNIAFDTQRASTFRKRTRVRAYRSRDPFTCHKPWGVQELRAGSFVMIPLHANGMPSEDIYGCAEAEFLATYIPVEGEQDIYAKSATILAYQPGEAFTSQTVMADGTVEVEAGKGAATDWIVQNPSGEVYRIDNETFCNTYEAL